MKKINFYIGANNTTKQVEKGKAKKIVSQYYEGMSVMDIEGVWKSEDENSIIIFVMCETVDFSLVKTVCKKLNKELDQQAIMVEVLDSNALFISDR